MGQSDKLVMEEEEGLGNPGQNTAGEATKF